MTRPIAMSILPAAAAGAKVGLESSTVNHSRALNRGSIIHTGRSRSDAAVLQTAVGRIATLGVCAGHYAESSIMHSSVQW